ncbi:unnamed protein product [Rotaria sordida]|uniref:Uncharacterized protein n=1 Tax=Rotaria sordida TaxID=392033 RepID=A0A814QHW1_9BILA|nr:unnamed protein product [Rotaria sordida]CAF1144140.1 unnamed protein product [Rotaria sordida]CAF1411047.1 unnamed protein product [Rotaria sordida]CAF4168987.1 unnamed protein product [Rotaria sordida]
MVDVLYSLVDINERFNRLIFNPLYIYNLDMTIITTKLIFRHSLSIDNQILDRICENVLPRIRHHVNKLTLEPNSMERVLYSFNYSQLYSLSLVDFQEEMLLQYLTEGDTILRNLLAEQITDLTIDIHIKLISPPLSKTLSNIFASILSLCKRLNHLNFCQLSNYRCLSIEIYNLSLTSCMSSTLRTLIINVETFNDCLCLLDGRLQCLSTLIIHVEDISIASSTIDNTKKLLKLKHFSLISFNRTDKYDNFVVPLLRRMINLEELKLYLSILRINSTYVNGVQLYDDILIYMPRLKKFYFCIEASVYNKDIRIDLPSNEDIQNSFMQRGYGPIGSYIQPILIERGIKLHITNNKPQKEKQKSSTLIIFRHLVILDLIDAHIDYAEQFLFDKNIHLPRLLYLRIRYESLRMVTNNFTNDEARLICGKLKFLEIHEPFVRPKNFHEYFPLL